MMSKRKKIGIITTVVVLSFVIMGIVYALLSDYVTIPNKLKLGTVKIDTLNLSLLKPDGKSEDFLEPGDMDTITWRTKNIGTSGILTRQTLEIKFTDEIDTDKTLLFLFPANLKDEKILEDYNKFKNGEETNYLIAKTESTSNGNGFKYQFIGDRLNGSDGNEVSQEVNYDVTGEIANSERASDDTSKTEDSINFRLFVNPEISYLLQGKRLSIKVTTEAMQYTEEGKDNWQVVGTQEINP